MAFTILTGIFPGNIASLQTKLKIQTAQSTILQHLTDNFFWGATEKNLIMMAQGQSPQLGHQARTVEIKGTNLLQQIKLGNNSMKGHFALIRSMNKKRGLVLQNRIHIDIGIICNQGNIEFIEPGKAFGASKTDHSEGIFLDCLGFKGEFLVF